MTIKLVQQKISKQELLQLAKETYGDMVKGVIDINKKIMALGGELHSDAEALLMEEGSLQKDLWGINIYPGKSLKERIEFSSLINIRPSQGFRSMDIKDVRLKEQITEIVNALIEK